SSVIRLFRFPRPFEPGEFFAVLFDHHVVRDRRGVLEVDRDFAGFRFQFGRVEGQRVCVRFSVERRAGRCAAASAAGVGFFVAFHRRFAGFVFGRADRFFAFDRAFGAFFGLFFGLLGFAALGTAFV